MDALTGLLLGFAPLAVAALTVGSFVTGSALAELLWRHGPSLLRLAATVCVADPLADDYDR
jgi:hypothetical protein